MITAIAIVALLLGLARMDKDWRQGLGFLSLAGAMFVALRFVP